ncbi:MAG: phospholipase D family protein [Burkholderiales bacterium]
MRVAPFVPSLHRAGARKVVGAARSTLQRAAVAAAALALAACGMAPLRMETPPSAALPPAPDSPLVKIATASQPSPELTGFRLMPLGSYSLDARVQLARRATHSLDVQYYQINDDRTGHLILRELRNAAGRGVRVRLLVDDLYTSGGDPLFAGLAAFPNIEVRLFNPFCCGRDSLLAKYTASLADFGRLNHRMHNKLFIADSAVVVAGGRNIADEYFMRSATDNFVDMDALMVGAVVPQLAHIFDTYWNSRHVYPVADVIVDGLTPAARRAQFDARVDEGPQMTEVTLPPVDILGYGPIADDLDAGQLGLVWGKATAFADSPEKITAVTDAEARSMSPLGRPEGEYAPQRASAEGSPRTVTMNVMDLVLASHSEVVLSSPYFVPGEMGVQAFGDLRRRSVKVTVLTNSLASNDEPLVHTGYARYRTALLKSGVDLYELSPSRTTQNRRLMLPGTSKGRLHAKTAVIDRRYVFIGSMNLDPRSASKNTELGVIADAPDLAKEVLRVIHISKLQSAYRLAFAGDGETLSWLTMDDDKEVVLLTEPDTDWWTRVRSVLFAPFVPEEQL